MISATNGFCECKKDWLAQADGACLSLAIDQVMMQKYQLEMMNVTLQLLLLLRLKSFSGLTQMVV